MLKKTIAFRTIINVPLILTFRRFMPNLEMEGVERIVSMSTDLFIPQRLNESLREVEMQSGFTLPSDDEIMRRVGEIYQNHSDEAERIKAKKQLHKDYIKRILLIYRDALVRETLGHLLRKTYSAHFIEECDNEKEALKTLAQRPFDLIFAPADDLNEDRSYIGFWLGRQIRSGAFLKNNRGNHVKKNDR